MLALRLPASHCEAPAPGRAIVPNRDETCTIVMTRARLRLTGRVPPWAASRRAPPLGTPDLVTGAVALLSALMGGAFVLAM